MIHTDNLNSSRCLSNELLLINRILLDLSRLSITYYTIVYAEFMTIKRLETEEGFEPL